MKPTCTTNWILAAFFGLAVAILCQDGFVQAFLTPVYRKVNARAAVPNAPIFQASTLFSDASSSADEVASADDENEDAVSEVAVEEIEASSDEMKPKRVVQRERHTIFIGNLPFDTTDTDLREMFSPHGTVELVSMPKDKETGQARGFAFVDMGSKEQVEEAIEAVHGTMHNGRTLRVQASLPKEKLDEQRERKIKDEGVTKLYVGNLPYSVTREDVMNLFSKYGVQDVYLPMNQQTGQPRGFAFVTLDENNADQAMEDTNGMEFLGRPLVVNPPTPYGEKTANSRPPRSERTKLYIGNLNFYTVPDTIRELFEEFGTVYDCYLPEDPVTGLSRGFGFVTLDADVAQEAIDATNGCEVDERSIRVNEAQPKRSRSNRPADDFEEE